MAAEIGVFDCHPKDRLQTATTRATASHECCEEHWHTEEWRYECGNGSVSLSYGHCIRNRIPVVIPCSFDDQSIRNLVSPVWQAHSHETGL